MKFLPRKFKETQQEWFGKRGITWHISYCVTKIEEEVIVTVFSHLFSQSVSQGSSVVSAVMRDTMQRIKQAFPCIS